MTTIPSPYSSLSDAETIRLGPRVSREDHAFLRGITSTGQLAPILCTLFHKLVETLKANGYSDYTDNDRLNPAITGLRLVLGSTADVPLETADSDDGRRTPPVDCNQTLQPHGRADVSLNASQRSPGRNPRGSRQEAKKTNSSKG